MAPPWDYDAFEERFRAWAASREDVRAAIVVGSRARADHPADAWSDLDVVLVTTDPDAYLDGTDWLHDLGDPWLAFHEAAAVGGVTERRVLFDPGLDVDVVPLSPAVLDPDDGLPEAAVGVLARGYRFLLDEDDLETRVEDLVAGVESSDGPALPDGATYHETVVDGWYHAVWVAKKLRRGETWTARDCLDGYLKRECLLPLAAWHARAVHDRDAWRGGRFLEEWADERVLEDLRGAVATYDEADCWRALAATMDLFRWVARETADALGYDYPREADERVTDLVESLAPG